MNANRKVMPRKNVAKSRGGRVPTRRRSFLVPAGPKSARYESGTDVSRLSPTDTHTSGNADVTCSHSHLHDHTLYLAVCDLNETQQVTMLYSYHSGQDYGCTSGGQHTVTTGKRTTVYLTTWPMRLRHDDGHSSHPSPQLVYVVQLSEATALGFSHASAPPSPNSR